MARVVKIEWDAPLEIDWELATDLLRQSIKGYTPIASGTLRSAFDEPQTITVNDAKNVITINVAPPSPAWPYARIQDEGGDIPPYECPPYPSYKPSWVMVAEIGGVTRFFTKRKGFHLPGFQYVDRGIQTWLDSPNWINIHWRAGKAGQGLRVIPGGIVSSA